MDTIILAGIRALGAHGVLPEEQGRPQPFEVDVELAVDLAPAGRSDVLSDTIDYDGLAARVVQIVEAGGPPPPRAPATPLAPARPAHPRGGGGPATGGKAAPPGARRRRPGAAA